MELVYSVAPSVKVRRDWVREEAAICSLSARNTIAFTTTVLVHSEQQQRYGATNSPSVVESWYHVYICDIDKPWQVHHVTSVKEKIVSLKWHINATHLLIAMTNGICQVWEMKDYLINNWHCQQTYEMKEELVEISWLQLGNKIYFNADQKDSPVYTDKMTRTKFKPSLSHFGGKPIDGWIAVTATGIVCIGLLDVKTTNQDGTVAKETLETWRCRIQVADIAFGSNGDILVVASDGYISSTIQCYKVSLDFENGQCKINCKATASLFAKCHIDNTLRDSPTSRITHVHYMHEESGESLIVGAGDTDCSHVELWNSTNEISRLHRFYQATGETTYSTQRWVHQSSISHCSLPLSISIPRFPVSYKPVPDAMSVLFQYVAIAYRDGSVKLVSKNNFQPMTTTNLDVGIELDGGEKRRRVVAHMTHMEQTLTGCGLVGLDQFHCLYVMKVVNTRDPVTQVLPVHLVGMLEYLLMNGYDWWEVLTAIRPGSIESVIQKLTDNFAKQTPIIQELIYTQFMAVKASLYRCSVGGQQKAADCHCKMVLHSISTLLKSILRPKAISGLDTSPAEKLSANCSKNYETDIDKVMMTLDPGKKEFVVEGIVLQSLQQLIQWIADLTLYLLSSLPTAQGYSNIPGSLLLRDSASLGAIREMLVVIRMWGLINISCLPHFMTTSANFDCLSHLFKLLTRVWVTVKEGGGAMEFEDSLVDECCLLPSQVIIPPVDEGLFGDTCYGSSIFMQQQPLKYTYDVKPTHLIKARPAVNLPEGMTMSRQHKDIVRLVTLGDSPSEQMRECSRCSCLSLLRSASKVMKAWELRFAKACLCGGQWKLHKLCHT